MENAESELVTLYLIKIIRKYMYLFAVNFR